MKCAPRPNPRYSSMNLICRSASARARPDANSAILHGVLPAVLHRAFETPMALILREGVRTMSAARSTIPQKNPPERDIAAHLDSTRRDAIRLAEAIHFEGLPTPPPRSVPESGHARVPDLPDSSSVMGL